jgi:phosphoglycerate dehydrogenase-like enzyme
LRGRKKKKIFQGRKGR